MSIHLNFTIIEYQKNLKLSLFVQSKTAQIENTEIIQPIVGQIINFLNLTTLSNYFEILNVCKTIEEKIFYVLYFYKERLNINELRRCLKNQTIATLMGGKYNLSKGLKEIYPQVAPMLKDTVFVDFLGLPQKTFRKTPAKRHSI